MIELDKDWVITRDKYQWILCKQGRRKRRGKNTTYLRPDSYYPNLTSLINAFVQRRATGEEYETLLELLADQEKFIAQTCAALEARFKSLCEPE